MINTTHCTKKLYFVPDNKIRNQSILASKKSHISIGFLFEFYIRKNYLA